MARLPVIAILSALNFVAHSSPVPAQGERETLPKPRLVPTLKVGDPAPPLNVTK